MSILDSASNAIKGAAAGTTRATKVLQLKGQLNDIAKQRSASAAQLGASLFEETHNDPTFRASRENIYSAIENLDAQRDALQAEIAQLEQEGQAAQQAALTYTCPKCGGRVGATDSFCVGCGTPIAEIKQNLNLCPQCGTPLEDDAAFCVGCGRPVDAPASGNGSAPQTAAASTARTCSTCGAPLEDDAAFCVGCGTPVAADDSDQPANETAATGEGDTQVDMGFVSNEAAVPDVPREAAAGSDESTAHDTAEEADAVSNEAVVADAPVEEAAPSEVPTDDIPGLCPKCGYENIDTAKFCYNCGNALQ